jgi:hypothetical protein
MQKFLLSKHGAHGPPSTLCTEQELLPSTAYCTVEVCRTVREPNCSRTFRKKLEFVKFKHFS